MPKRWYKERGESYRSVFGRPIAGGEPKKIAGKTRLGRAGTIAPGSYALPNKQGEEQNWEKEKDRRPYLTTTGQRREENSSTIAACPHQQPYTLHERGDSNRFGGH